MGLATGVEVKSEAAKTVDVVTAAPVEELKAVVSPIEPTAAPSATTSVEGSDATEVTLCSLTVSEDRVFDFLFVCLFCIYFF